MINVSNKFKTAMDSGNRNFQVKLEITLSDSTVLNITNANVWQGSFSIEDAVSGDSEFQIGSAIVNKLTFNLNNIDGSFTDYDFYDAIVKAFVGLEFDDGTTETVRKGTYTVDNVTHNGELISLECLDYMAKFQKSYSGSTLSYPATRLAILNDACTNCGVVLATTSFDGSSLVVQSRPDAEALTYQQVIAWVAQLSCKWARCNANGELELLWFDKTNLTADTPTSGSYHDFNSSVLSGSPSVEESDVTITGIQVSVEGDESTQTGFYGETGYVLSIEGNDLIVASDVNTIATSIGEQLVGVKFRPLDISCLSNPLIEAGDIMIVTDRKNNSYRAIVTSTTFNLGNWQSVSCGAETPGRNSSTQYSESTKTYVALRNLVQKEKSARELAVESLADSLANSSGMYTTQETQEDGSTITYLHDKPTMAESQNIIKITSEAIGVSNDGGATYPYGFVLTGTMITKLLYAEGINADFINTGSIEVKDDSGNVVFLCDIDTGEVTINAQSMSIGGKTVATTEDVADSMGLAVTLSNEFQGVPSNSDGSDPDLSDCKTTVAVMYGKTDVTSQCTFTFAKSSGVTGNWDSTTKTYTVTGLTTDTGWVDITASYVKTATASKRFGMTKAKQGLTSTGRIYYLEQSALILSKQDDGNFSPSEVTFSAYYREGDSTERVEYAGRFKVEETTDGSNFSTVYTSPSNETNTTNYPYASLNTEDGQAIMTEDGNYLGFASKVTSFRCTLYAADGFDYPLDMVSVAVVNDTTALDSDEIFNLLTDNGTAQGIYKEGDQLYISFTYAKGGTLKLGGSSNTYGVLQVLDGSGNVVGQWDKDGITLPSNTKIAWSQVTGTSNIATKTDATTISQNAISTATITANQIIGNTLTLGGSTGTSLTLKYSSGKTAASLTANGFYLYDNSGNTMMSLTTSTAKIAGLTLNSNGITIPDSAHGIYLGGGGGLISTQASQAILQCVTGNRNVLWMAPGGQICLGYSGSQIEETSNILAYTSMFYADDGAFISSDERLKKDIEKIDTKASYDLIQGLSPVSFRYKSNNSLNHGFIAQEVQSLVDSEWCVIKEYTPIDSDESYLALSYESLIADIVGAIKYLGNQLEGVIKKNE